MPEQKLTRVPRETDERVVDWLRLSACGLSSPAIASAYGTTAAFVRATIKRVRDADLAESGERPRTVLAGYG